MKPQPVPASRRGLPAGAIGNDQFLGQADTRDIGDLKVDVAAAPDGRPDRNAMFWGSSAAPHAAPLRSVTGWWSVLGAHGVNTARTQPSSFVLNIS